MSQKNVSTEIDPGSMSVFSEQILEAVGGARAVTVHDTAQQLVWSSSDDTSGNAHAYAFDLTHVGCTDPIGTLSVLSDAPWRDSAEFVYETIEPILRCVERQIDITTELSSVRRLSVDSRLGLKLLLEFDDIDENAGPEATIRELLERSAAHFRASFSAVLLPAAEIQVIHPEPTSMNESRDRQRMGMLGSQVSKAKIHRKVTKWTTRGSHIVSTPVIDWKDDVIGVFVVARKDGFSRDQIRLCRAIGAKIDAFKNGPAGRPNSQLSRHDFLRYVAEVIKRDATSSHAMLVVDIDQLHVVNDKFGHMAGDAVIQSVDRLLNGLNRRGDMVARLGGDTFGVFLRAAGEDEVVRRADHIVQSIAGQIVQHDSRSVSTTASVGIALIPDVVGDAQAGLSTAEVATRSAKSRGGDRLVVFRDLDASVVQRRCDLDQVGRLQSALLDDRFVLFAQQIKAIQTEETAPRYEILVRMLDEQGTILPPEQFLSAAERYQMMAAIDRWVVRRALDQLSAADNPLEINLGSFSINVSAQSLMDKGFLDFVENQIAESGVPPSVLCFEITETSVVRSLEIAQYFITRLRHLGCRIALDDFGTGYCSFAYLKDLHVNYVKIDGVFVRDILENPLSDAIVASLTRIGEVMPASIVAEHVETDLVMQRLRQLGVNFAQGFGIGKPRPLQDVLKELDSPEYFAADQSTAAP